MTGLARFDFEEKAHAAWYNGQRQSEQHRISGAALMPEEEFERHVELLDVPVEGFVMSHADVLGPTLS